jgi:hypothetical protein
MNPGVIEEGAAVTKTFMDVLKNEPISLALVVMNVALLIIFYFILMAVSQTREREINLLFSEQKDVRELLARCVVPPRGELDHLLPKG